MSTLEVLRSFPTQLKALLSAIGEINPQDSNLVIFDMEKSRPCLSHQLAFQMQVMMKGKDIHLAIINEVASTYVMATSY